jgi:hypothetical protein
VAPGLFAGGRGERPAITAVSPDRMCSTSAAGKIGPASGMGRPKISPLGVMINLDHRIRIRLACRTVAMLQTMRVRLAATAMMISGPVGPDTMTMVIMVRSMIIHSMAIAMVAAKARRGSVSGSQRMRRPVVARVPPGVAMISGMTGMATTNAIRPVRQGPG